jgi:hypothetical protein
VISEIHVGATPTAVRVEQNDIEQFLCLYRPEFMHIAEAEYDRYTLWVTCRHYPLEFHVSPLSHLSRVQIVHYLGQAAYVLGGCLAQRGLLGSIDQDEYLRLLRNERCTFRKLKLSFRRFLPNTPGTAIMLQCTGTRQVGRNLIFPLTFELNQGDCFGEAHAVLIPT